MKTTLALLTLLTLTVALAASDVAAKKPAPAAAPAPAIAPAATSASAGWQSLFDGKTLKGWDGKKGFWTVEDGAITGTTTKENPTKGNTFIIWTGGKVADFELTFEYRFMSDSGNSGCQYRSEHVGNNVVKGYQGDFEAGTRYSGINYGERTGRGILSDRGHKTTYSADDKKTVEKFGDSKKLQENVKGKGQWNTMHISAIGNHMIHKINGVVMSETIDGSKKAVSEGILALQLHAGPPMKIQFRNIKLKTVKKAARVEVKPDGTVLFRGEKVDHDVLRQAIKAHPEMFEAGIIVVADKKTAMKDLVTVMSLCRDAGVETIKVATLR